MDAGRSPICLGRGGDACVLVERAKGRGNALYLAWASEAHAACEAHASCKGLGRSILPEPIEAVGAQLDI
jgi:hypothetical protein